MVKVNIPQPFTFEGGGDRAVLLLHGFTGNSADVRMLGRYLEKRGYTSHAPHMQGHGVPPEELFAASPKDWWRDVVAGYEHLQSLGYEKIAVGGLSLGGVFSLKLGYTYPVKGIIPMCAPMEIRGEDIMHEGVIRYTREFKEYEGKSSAVIDEEISALGDAPRTTIKALQTLLNAVRSNIDMIYTPTFVVQARHDQMIEPKSAEIIYEGVECDDKHLKWYEESSHVITLDKEKDQLHEDVYEFLESLNWDDV
ncbi:alpha/beta hydrolase [Salisediminibacterium halotolerans]|uniref:Carboxylesterase n=1 Tax=Salisediminibacterium halotolerans TaxID=517425 RepID=A0A1H9VPH0_9BACI|nr:carboxylesterase [Salisediminibacterium haloalkalitolerans]SES23444.1 carboxylesterase [Salisediminibacterium haloalkalitolerans]